MCEKPLRRVKNIKPPDIGPAVLKSETKSALKAYGQG